MFNELCRCSLQQWGLAQFTESNVLFCQEPELFGDFHGSPLTHKSIGCSPVLVLEVSFGDKRCPVGTLSPPLFGDFIRIAFIYFKKFPLHQISIPPSKMSLNSSCLSPHSFPQPHLSPQILPLPPSAPSQTIKSILLPSSGDIHVLHP